MLLEEPGKGELDLGRAEQAELSRAVLGSKGEAETLLPSAVVWELWCVSQGGRHCTPACVGALVGPQGD